MPTREHKYRYTHTHKGIVALAPEFWAKNDDDARAYVRTLTGALPGKPLVPCYCGGQKLERRVSHEKSGNVIEFRSVWTEVELRVSRKRRRRTKAGRG